MTQKYSVPFFKSLEVRFLPPQGAVRDTHERRTRSRERSSIQGVEVSIGECSALCMGYGMDYRVEYI